MSEISFDGDDFKEWTFSRGEPFALTVDYAKSEQTIAEIGRIYEQMQEPIANLAAMIGQHEAEVFVYDLISRVLSARA